MESGFSNVKGILTLSSDAYHVTEKTKESKVASFGENVERLLSVFIVQSWGLRR